MIETRTDAVNLRQINLRATLAAAALVLAGLCGLGPAQAQITGEPIADPRIREVVYMEDQIVTVRARMGYEMVIEFDPNERIENVSIGDSLSWQVTPNRKATLLFIKPMARAAPTSMTVASNQRLYSFLLTTYDSRGANDPDATFRLRFHYPLPPAPPAEPLPPPPPQPTLADFNFSYTYKGQKTLYPERVFDDGKITYFEFAQGKDTPAVFVVGSDGAEEMANTRIQGRYTVADFIAKTFILRYGKASSTIVNTTWREPATSAVSSPPAVLPQPRRD